MKEKEQFGVNMQAQLDEWKQKADEAKNTAAERGEDFMQRLRPDLDKLSDKYEEAKYKLELLRMSSEDAWGEMRDGFEKAFDVFKDSVNKAFSKF